MKRQEKKSFGATITTVRRELSRLDYRSAAVRVVSSVSVLIALILVFAAFSLHQSYRATQDAAKATVENIAALLFEDVQQSISSVDRGLELTVFLLEKHGVERAINTELLRDFSDKQLYLRPEIVGIYVTDAAGRVIFPSPAPGIPLVTVDDRDYFKSLRNNPGAAPYISSPIVGRFTGKNVLAVARAHRRTDGTFAGVVVATLPVSRYADRFSQLQIGKQDIFNLFDQHRVVLMRFPEVDPGGKSTIGVRLGSKPLMELLDKGRKSGTYQAVSPLDGVERISTFRIFDQVPLGMVVGVSVDAYMSKWREDLYRMLGLVIGFALLSIWLTWLTLRAWRRQAGTHNFARAIVDSSPVALYSRDTNGCVTQWNPAAEAMFGWTEEEAIGRPLRGLSDSQREESEGLIARVLAGETLQNLEITRTPKNGADVEISATMAPLLDSANKVIGVLSLATNVTESKKAARRISHMAYHDVLTGLPNRALLEDRFRQAAASAQRTQRSVALIFLDVDNFKTINDSLGHNAGDVVLCELSARLQGCLRETDTVSRHGGDEFLLLLPELSSPEILGVTLQKILQQARVPCRLDGVEFATTVSIGVAMYPQDGSDFDTLLRLADIAMYRSKSAGKDRATLFDASMNEAAQEHLLIRNGLRQALEREEFVLHYQPLVALDTGALVGVEALIRWQHPVHGLTAPGRFISVAEESGLIVPMGEWVLREACRQAMQWSREGMAPMTVAVNLSAVQFKRGPIEDIVKRVLDTSGLPPGLLELELTESILIQDVDEVLASVKRLKALGVRISIDDFGTGYSSLAYLQRFAVDKLKIDQTFVRNIVDNPDDAAIVRAIIDLAHSLKLDILSEGIETPEAARCLWDMGCRLGQGYYFSKPLSANAIPALFAAGLDPNLSQFQSL